MDANNEELMKTIVSFSGVLISATIAALVGYLARNVSLKTLRFEQLKFINQLANEKAWKYPASHFIVEEPFRAYFNVFIPIDIIKIISLADSKYYSFLAYSKVCGLVNINKEKDKVILPRNETVRYKRWANFAATLATIHIALFILFLSYTILTIALLPHVVFNYIFSFVFALVGIFFFFCGKFTIDTALGLGRNLESLKRSLGKSRVIEAKGVEYKASAIVGSISILLITAFYLAIEYKHIVIDFYFSS